MACPITQGGHNKLLLPVLITTAERQQTTKNKLSQNFVLLQKLQDFLINHARLKTFSILLKYRSSATKVKGKGCHTL